MRPHGQDTLRNDGVRGFFAGYPAKAAQVVVQDTTFYFWLSSFKAGLGPSVRAYVGDAGSSMLCAAAAAAVNILLTLPLEVVTTRMQTRARATSTRATLGYTDTFAAIWRREGVAALWHGLEPSLVLTSNPALQFMMFDTLMKFWTRRRTDASHSGPARASALAVFFLAALAKAFALTATYPLIRAKVMMMAARSKRGKGEPRVSTSERACACEGSGAEAKHSAGMRNVVARIIQQEGVAGLFYGLPAQLTKTVLGAALVMLIKDRLTKRVRAVLGALWLRLALAIGRSRQRLPPSQ